MNVKVENIEKNVIMLEIEIDAERFEAGIERAFKKNAGKFNIPGFRKGKAPRKVIERYYGEGVLFEDAINIVCPEAYDEAVENNQLCPVDRPEFDIKQVGHGQNMIFTAKVTVKPEVTLGEYRGIEVTKPEVTVTDEAVAIEIDKIREKHARVKSVEDRPIKNGDTAVIDFEGFIDGVPFEGGKGSDHELEIGSGEFIPGFEEQLIGVEVGADVEVNVAFPEDYHAVDLAGKTALFKVIVNDVKEKELPEIDDEFAKDISEFDTFEEYRTDLKEKLLKGAEQQAKVQTENAVIEKVVENAEVEIPDVMVERQIDHMVYDFETKLKYQRMDLQTYTEIMGISYEELREKFKDKALREVKTHLVIEKISNVEKIDVTQEDIDEEIKKLADNYNREFEEFKKQFRPEDVEYVTKSLEFKKTVDILIENAKIA